ncbi:hypothetical protein J132_07110 [Termitomyces sp. J132]|nr:hypothetical protein J132_07110 [Termitomyces sp. J132]
MTPEESTTLVVIGKDLRKTFAAIIFEALLFPIYGGCVYKACSILIRKTRTWMMTINMTIIITMFLIATTLVGIDLANYVTEITDSFIHNPDLGIDERYENASNVTFKRVVVIDALYGYMNTQGRVPQTVLGDIIVVWRVWAFWGNGKRRWALVLLCSMLLGSLITTFLLTYCVAVLGTDIFDGSFQRPAFCRNIQTASYAMPAATTFVATAFIGIATWFELFIF